MKHPGIQYSLLVAATLAASAPAQTIFAGGNGATSAIMAPAGGVAMSYSSGFVGDFMGPLANVSGQPFSAQQETRTVQTLADGTHIINGTQKVMFYRDSQGRTRTETTVPAPQGFLAPPAPIFINISDPVSGYRYTFDLNSRAAYRSPFAPVRAPNAVAAYALPTAIPKPAAIALNLNPQPPGPETTRDQLGSQSIEGVAAEGVKITTTFPVGFFGNDRPITTSSETWTSRDLGMAVLTKTSDPRFGDTTTKLTNISRAEPEPSLFQPPPGYEIVDPQ